MSAPSSRPWPLRLVIALLRLAWTLLVISAPLAGVWIASSLAALGNGPLWLVALAGALAVPLLPLAWEGLSAALRRRRMAKKKTISKLRSRGAGRVETDARISSLWDRLVLRTLAVNLVFVGGLLWSRPATVYEAVSARGDWMLEGVEAPWAEALRRQLHAAAEGFEWLHERTHENAYEDLLDEEFTAPPPPRPGAQHEPGKASGQAAESGSGQESGRAGQGEALVEEDEPVDLETIADAVEAERWPMWPQASEPHPLIVDLPSAAEVSIEALAAYVVEHERDPFGRVKALHDYVATRVAYDYETYKAGGPFPSQSAEHVFATRTSVCAGYANLLAALVTEAGGEAVVVSGYSRKLGGGLSGEGHAWNAVKIEGEWYLVDATWDAGGASPEGDWRFEYGSDYLFAPPEIIGLTHFPDDPGWQLRTRPLERGEFLRQPMLRPRFFADGFEPITELRSHFDVDEALSVSLANHDGQFVLAHAVSSEGAVDCSVLGRQTLEIRCELPRRGQYEVQIFANDERYGDFHYVGSLAVNRVS